MTPSSVSNRNRALPVPAGSGKPGVELNTVPVGPSPATLTTSGTIDGGLLPLYSVETFMPLSATHHGDVPLAVSPHALTRLPSLIVPPAPVSLTSGCTT